MFFKYKAVLNASAAAMNLALVVPRATFFGFDEFQKKYIIIPEDKVANRTFRTGRYIRKGGITPCMNFWNETLGGLFELVGDFKIITFQVTKNNLQ